MITKTQYYIAVAKAINELADIATEEVINFSDKYGIDTAMIDMETGEFKLFRYPSEEEEENEPEEYDFLNNQNWVEAFEVNHVYHALKEIVGWSLGVTTREELGKYPLQLEAVERLANSNKVSFLHELGVKKFKTAIIEASA